MLHSTHTSHLQLSDRGECLAAAMGTTIDKENVTPQKRSATDHMAATSTAGPPVEKRDRGLELRSSCLTPVAEETSTASLDSFEFPEAAAHSYDANKALKAHPFQGSPATWKSNLPEPESLAHEPPGKKDRARVHRLHRRARQLGRKLAKGQWIAKFYDATKRSTVILGMFETYQAAVTASESEFAAISSERSHAVVKFIEKMHIPAAELAHDDGSGWATPSDGNGRSETAGESAGPPEDNAEHFPQVETVLFSPAPQVACPLTDQCFSAGGIDPISQWESSSFSWGPRLLLQNQSCPRSELFRCDSEEDYRDASTLCASRGGEPLARPLVAEEMLELEEKQQLSLYTQKRSDLGLNSSPRIPRMIWRTEPPDEIFHKILETAATRSTDCSTESLSFSGSPRLLSPNRSSPEQSRARTLFRCNSDHRDASAVCGSRGGEPLARPLVAEEMLEEKQCQLSLQLSLHKQKMSNLGLNSSPRVIPRIRRTEPLDEIYDKILGTAATRCTDCLKQGVKESLETYVSERHPASETTYCSSPALTNADIKLQTH